MLILTLFILLLTGCAASTERATHGDEMIAPPMQASKTPPALSSFPGDKGDVDRLARLWESRYRENTSTNYPLGPGDVVEISVPAVEELRSRIVRISADGTIELPLTGKIRAAGLTEDALKQELEQKLRQYMYNPRIILFIKEYRSRQVAVLGAVVKPGLYGLSNGSDTILDMISQAGGIAQGADPRIYLIPAEPAEAGQVRQITAALPENLMRQDPALMILKKTDPILIDIKQLAYGGFQQYLSLTVRPGDVIMVPGGGQVLVEGWVEKPGAYKISSGLTVAGVVGEAGGSLYPADINAVKVIRTDRGGNKSFIVADLEKIKRGDSADVALQSGDIVEVSSENSKLIPYGLYRFFTTVVSIGVGGTVPFMR